MVRLFGLFLVLLYLGFMSSVVMLLATILAQWMAWQWGVMIATPIMLIWTGLLMRPVTEEIGHE